MKDSRYSPHICHSSDKSQSVFTMCFPFIRWRAIGICRTFAIHQIKVNQYSPRVSHSLDEGQSVFAARFPFIGWKTIGIRRVFPIHRMKGNRYLPRVSHSLDERPSVFDACFLFIRWRTVGDPFVIHFYLGIFVGRMPYAPTLSDEGIREDRLAILFF